MNEIETIKCGSLVVIRLANIKGIVTCASIRYDRVTYEITYYEGVTQKVIWAHQDELEVSTSETTKIGYKK